MLLPGLSRASVAMRAQAEPSPARLGPLLEHRCKQIRCAVQHRVPTLPDRAPGSATRIGLRKGLGLTSHRGTNLTDPARLAALHGPSLLDSPFEPAFDRLTRLAARLLNAPVALVSLVDADRQFFKSCVGVPEPWASARETPLSHSFCQHVVMSREPMIVADARADPRVHDNLAIPDLGVIAYAGIPLISLDGYALGSFCVIDSAPREWTEAEIETLRDLAASVETEIELRADLIARASAEQALQEVKDELEQRVEDRTADLADANSRLERALVRREQAESSLRNSDERFRALVQHASDLITIMGVDGTILYESPSLERHLGHRPEDLVGKNAFAYVHPEDVPAVVRAFTDAVQAPGTHPSVEFRFRHADGSWRLLEATGTNLLDNPEVGGIVANCRDITERRQAEDALRDSDVRFHSLVEATSDAIISMDSRGRITAWNKGAQTIFGYGQDEVHGQMLTELMPEHYRAAHRLGVARMTQSGEARLGGATVELAGLRKDGTEFPLELSIASWKTRDETFYGSVIRDISERKRAEAALRESEEQFRGTYAAVGQATMALDGTFLKVNRAFCELVGYEEAELLTRSMMAITHPNDLPHILGLVHNLGAGELSHVNLEKRYIRKDGAVVTALLSAALMRDAAGEPRSLIALVQDITERKRVEDALRAARAEAERANLAKSEFLSRMSHELRTPLNAILGFAQLLEMADLAALDRESVDQIMQAGRHLLALINEVLDITRIEAGRLELSIEAVPLSDLAGECLDLIAPLAGGRMLEIHADLDAARGRGVRVDRQRFKQILLNLLSNAVKYNRPGGSVILATEQISATTLRLSVHDTGAGILPEKLERLFNPFERLGAEQTEVEGTGLGLALSKRLAEAMGLTLDVRSTIGVGTTFSVDLPLANASGAELLPAAVDLLANTEEPVGAKVLYIEDNPANMRLIERTLARRPDIELLTAMQGGLGLLLAREQQPDAIFLDLHLPDMGGYELLQALRADAATAVIPVIVVSADATPHQIERLTLAGAQAYLTKPLDLHQFLKVLDETLLKESV